MRTQAYPIRQVTASDRPVLLSLEHFDDLARIRGAACPGPWRVDKSRSARVASPTGRRVQPLRLGTSRAPILVRMCGAVVSLEQAQLSELLRAPSVVP